MFYWFYLFSNNLFQMLFFQTIIHCKFNDRYTVLLLITLSAITSIIYLYSYSHTFHSYTFHDAKLIKQILLKRTNGLNTNASYQKNWKNLKKSNRKRSSFSQMKHEQASNKNIHYCCQIGAKLISNWRRTRIRCRS